MNEKEKYRAVFRAAAAQGLTQFCDAAGAINVSAIFGQSNYCKLSLPYEGSKELTLASGQRVRVSRPGHTFVSPANSEVYEVYLFNTVPDNGLFVNIPVILHADTHRSNVLVRNDNMWPALDNVRNALLGGAVPVDLHAVTREDIGSGIFTQASYRTIITVICTEINRVMAGDDAHPVPDQPVRVQLAIAGRRRKRRSREVGPPTKRVKHNNADVVIVEDVPARADGHRVVLFRTRIPRMDRAACARLFRSLATQGHPLFFPTLTLGKGVHVVCTVEDAVRHMAGVAPYAPYVLFLLVAAENVAYVEESIEQHDKTVMLRTLSEAIALRHHQARAGAAIDRDAYVSALEGYWIASNDIARRAERLARAAVPPEIAVVFGGVVSGVEQAGKTLVVDF